MPKLEVWHAQPTGSVRLRLFTAAQASNEAFPNGVRDIALEVLITGEVELRRQLTVAGVTDLDVQVRGSEAVPSEEGKHRAEYMPAASAFQTSSSTPAIGRPSRAVTGPWKNRTSPASLDQAPRWCRTELAERVRYEDARDARVTNVGAGPAGLVVATRLRQRGLSAQPDRPRTW